MPTNKCEFGSTDGGQPCEQQAIVSLWLEDKQQEVWLCIEHAGELVEKRHNHKHDKVYQSDTHSTLR